MGNDTTKIFVPEGNDNALMASMMNGCGNSMWNNPIWAIVFLAALRNGGIFGNNGGEATSIQDQLSTIQGQNALMAAINGGTSEVKSLASMLNCDVNSIQNAINSVQSSICNVGNQIGMTRESVINAITSGNTALANQICQCCNQTQQNILKMGYENQIANLQQTNQIQTGFSTLGYNLAEQSCLTRQNATDNTGRVLAKLDAIEDSRKDREINALTAALASANARAERQAELAPINKALSEIMAKQPSTATIQYPNLVGVPASVYYGYGTYTGTGTWG